MKRIYPSHRLISTYRSPLALLMTGQMLGMGLLVLWVILASMAVVYSKHLSRTLHIALQELQVDHDKLRVEWSQLLLEQGTLGSDVRVEKVAREQLGMQVPESNQVRVIRP